MTNNPTIDGVSRELLERAIAAFERESRPLIAQELRALLAAPVVERQDAAARLKQAEQSISNLIGFGFEANEIQAVNAGDLLAVYMAGCTAQTEVAAPVVERCASCDDSGDLIDLTGEWRGYCACPIGEALKNKQTAPPQLAELQAEIGRLENEAATQYAKRVAVSEENEELKSTIERQAALLHAWFSMFKGPGVKDGPFTALRDKTRVLLNGEKP